MSQVFIYPPSGSASANPSVGTNNAPIPTSATLVGGQSPTNTLVPLHTDASGNLLVAPLTNSSVVKAQLQDNNGLAVVLGQQTAAGSLPVVLTASQLTTLTPLSTVTVIQPTGTNLHTVVDSSALPAGASTSALQTSGNTTLSTISTTLGSILLDLTNGTQITQISGTVPLPTGAATAANQATEISSLSTIATQTNVSTNGAATSALQTTGNTSLASIDSKTPALGQATMSASQPITIASDQTPISTKIGPTTTLTSASYNSTTGVINTDLMTGTVNGWYDASAFNSMNFDIYATTTVTGGVISFEQSNDITNNPSGGSLAAQLSTGTSATFQNAYTLVASTIGKFSMSITARYIRLRISTAFTGTGTFGATITMRQNNFSQAVVGVANATAANLLAQVNQGSTSTTANNAWFTKTTDGTNVAAVKAASTAPLAADPALVVSISPNSVASVTSPNGRTSANAPQFNSYTVTNVTTAAYTQLIASTTAAINYLDVFDSSGQTMILATGAAGSEVVFAYLPPGGDQISVTIPAGTRIAIKALTANATSGYNLLNCWK